MLTDQQIQDLISCPKKITSREPAKDYQEESRHRRCDLGLVSAEEISGTFTVFIRQSAEFIENFSIGLRYLANDPTLGTVTLIRYNGPHGETSRDPDGHYAKPHIHRITASELQSGNAQPQERDREITDRYSTFERGLAVFFQDTHIGNFEDHFPDIQKGSVFDDHV